MSIAELADFLQIPKARIYSHWRRELKRGFPAVWVGRRWQVDLDAMIKWMCAREEALEAERLSPSGSGKRTET